MTDSRLPATRDPSPTIAGPGRILNPESGLGRSGGVVRGLSFKLVRTPSHVGPDGIRVADAHPSLRPRGTLAAAAALELEPGPWSRSPSHTDSDLESGNPDLGSGRIDSDG